MKKNTGRKSPLKPAPRKRVKFVIEKGECSNVNDRDIEKPNVPDVCNTWGVRGKRSCANVQKSGVEDGPTENPKSYEKEVTNYGGPVGLERLVGQLTEKQKQAVREINFGGLLSLKLSRFNHGMVPFLLGAYHPATRQFHVDDNKECFITVYDVYDVFMLPFNTGKKVILATNKKQDKHHMEYIQEWREKFNVAPKKELSAESVAGEMYALGEGGDDFKRCFVLYALGTLLAPEAHKNVDLHLLPSVKIVEDIGGLDWCEYILSEIGEAVNKWRSRKVKNVGGCMLFLQLVYFHRLAWQCKKAPSELSLIQHWTTENLKSRIEEERKASLELNGKYGNGEWDSLTYPVSKKREEESERAAKEAENEMRTKIESTKSDNDRIVSFKIPDDLLTDAEIRDRAKNECEIDAMLIIRDQEIHSRLTLERVGRIKINAQKLSDMEKEKMGDGVADNDVEVTFTQLVENEDVMRSCDELVERVIEVTKAAKEMPSFDLGINDEGFNRFQNISPPRKSKGLVRVRGAKRKGPKK